MKRVRCSLLLIALMLVTLPVIAQEPQVRRDDWQRVDDVFREMGIGPGSHVADLGAGGGYFTTRLAQAVGAEGRVYAVDVNPVSLRELREALPKDLTNIEIVRAEEDDPKLPAGQLDAVLVVNAYHEFAEYAAVLARVREALQPGGRLVLIEPTPQRAEDTTRAAQTKRHEIAIGVVLDRRRNAFALAGPRRSPLTSFDVSSRRTSAWCGTASLAAPLIIRAPPVTMSGAGGWRPVYGPGSRSI